MWFYIYIDRQSTNVQNFGTICWFWPWFISSRSRLLFHKLLQRYCNLELDIISFLWCLGLTLIFINFRTSIQGKEMIVTFCISQRGQSKDCVAQRRMGRKLPYKLQSGRPFTHFYSFFWLWSTGLYSCLTTSVTHFPKLSNPPNRSFLPILLWMYPCSTVL